MQLSELYRRGIVVPLDQESEERIRAYDVDANSNVRHLKIPSDNLFLSLWRIGLFDEINRRCGTLVDDYEEEIIDAQLVGMILDAVDAKLAAACGDANSVQFLHDLRELVREALSLSRPVLFVL